jgi:hypothetical protein
MQKLLVCDSIDSINEEMRNSRKELVKYIQDVQKALDGVREGISAATS